MRKKPEKGLFKTKFHSAAFSSGKMINYTFIKICNTRCHFVLNRNHGQRS